MDSYRYLQDWSRVSILLTLGEKPNKCSCGAPMFYTLERCQNFDHKWQKSHEETPA